MGECGRMENLTDVTEDVIESEQSGQGSGTEEIVVADIFVPCRHHGILISQNQLNNGKNVEDRNRHQIPRKYHSLFCELTQ